MALSPLTSRFWARVNEDGPVLRPELGPCWPWGCGPGYGQVQVGPTRESTHRISWEIHVGPIPPGLCVCHKCDNPPCVNPAHLFLGTHLDNARDREAKGRGHHGPLGRAGARRTVFPYGAHP